MIAPYQSRRIWFMALLLTCAFFGLGARLYVVQVIRHDELAVKASKFTARSELIDPLRGQIRDIKGNVLAASRQVKTVVANPFFICNTNVGNRLPELAQVVGPLLDMDTNQIVSLVQNRMVVTNKAGKVVPCQYVVLKRNVPVPVWQQIEQAMLNHAAWSNDLAFPKSVRPHYKNLRKEAVWSEDDQIREYPNEIRAAHVIGFVGTPEKVQTNNAISRVKMVGKAGIECVMNEVLTGAPGWRQTERNRNGKEMVAWRKQEVEPSPALNVVLTLDMGVQNILESELADAMQKHSPLSAMGIVVRPSTGEILAMAVLPSYDPSDPAQFPMENLRNRIVTDQNEPGSTFKIVAATAALNERLITLQDRFDCEEGRFIYAKRALTDHGKKYGVMSVEDIIAKSSNIGVAKIALKLGKERLFQYIKDFGFGEQTFIPLPGEVTGTVRRLSNWEEISITRVPMGQEICTTAIQSAMSMCAIANGGRLMRPMLIDRIEDEKGGVVVKYQPQYVRQVCRPEIAKAMVTALKSVATTNGTAIKSSMENYTVAGKTGTAQKANGKLGYMPGKYYTSFIGFFPAETPELCIYIGLDEPKNGHMGGLAAGPYFKNVADKTAKYLGIKPEFMKDESVTASGRSSNSIVTMGKGSNGVPVKHN